MTGILLTSNVDVMIALSFLEGLSASCTQAVGYIYMMEFLPEKQQALYASIYSSYDNCITFLIATIYFRFISKEWVYLALLGYVLQIICVCLVWLLPESPKFLLELNRLDETEAAMIRIAWFTGATFDPFELSELNNDARSPLASSQRTRRDSYDSVLRQSGR